MIDTNYLMGKFKIFSNELVDHIPNTILSIFIFIIFYIIAEYYKSSTIGSKAKLINSSKSIFDSNSKFEIETNLYQETETNMDTLDNNLIFYQINWIIYYSIIVFGLIISLVNLGFNVVTIFTLLGSIGLALGLAFQETLKNIISGVYIALSKLYKIGDLITIKPIGNENSTSGRIIDFNLYYTTIINQYKQISIIPNSIIQNNILTNITMSKNNFY
jgi:small-conductance mechanosensitive channel